MNETAEAEALIAVAAIKQLAKDGTTLRQVRVDNALSLADMAKAVGVTPSAISRWESGLRSPRGDAARRLAIVVGGLCQMEEP